MAGVGDVVGDQDPGAAEIDEVGRGRQDPGNVETLLDTRVVLDVHRVDVLDPERVAERRADEQATPRDREDHLRVVAVVRDSPGELEGRLAG